MKKYILFILLLLILYGCSSSRNPIIEEHEKTVLEFWKKDSSKIIDFFLEYEKYNEIWCQKIKENNTLKIGSSRDSVLSKNEKSNLSLLVPNEKFVQAEIHVGPKNGLTTEFFIPENAKELYAEKYWKTGLVYGILIIQREDIGVNCFAFLDTSFKVKKAQKYNSIQLEIRSKKGNCKLIYRLE
jgi:hypothetical protein